VSVPHIDWMIAGLECKSVLSAQGGVLLSLVMASVLLFPMPLNSRGEIIAAAATCYRRMWRTLFYMLFFAAGSVWRRRPVNAAPLPETPRGIAAVVLVKTVIGHLVLQMSVWAISYVAREFVEGCLRLYVKYVKPRTAGPTKHTGVDHGTVNMRLVAISVVELAQDVTGALVAAHGVPRVFDAMHI